MPRQSAAPSTTTYEPRFRDRVAHRLANLALRFASPTYRDFVKGSMVLGMRAASEQAHAHSADGALEARRALSGALADAGVLPSTDADRAPATDRIIAALELRSFTVRADRTAGP